MIPLITGFFVETAIALGLYKNSRDQRRRSILILGVDSPVHIPILDRWARWMAGDLNKFEEAISNRIVEFSRRFVHTKTFEHFVRALVNRKSRLHRSASALRHG